MSTDDPSWTRLLADPTWPACEGLIAAFERAWGRGEAPAVRDYARADGEAGRALLVELVHVDLEFRLKAAEAARVEHYLAEFPALADDAAEVVSLLAAEYALRRRRGEVLRATEYAARFPQHRNALLAQIAASPGSTFLDHPSVVAAPAAPPAVAGYEVLGELGRGGMGVVYRARDVRLDRLVALKFVPQEYARDPERLDRFLREARTASALNHPNICTVHALGEHEGRPFLVMEFIEGHTLQRQIGRRHAPEELVRMLGQAARALAAAHAAGVVHRDVKPENVMVRADGLVKVVDFGLARRLPSLGAGTSADSDPREFRGTAAYASPEQALGQAATERSDVFSLGVVLYQLATGVHPFEAGSPLGFLHGIAHRTPVPPAQLNPEATGPLAVLIESMLDKDPRLRPTAAEVERSLRTLTAAQPTVVAAPPAPPTVGRAAERAALRAAWTDAEAGRGTVLCVSGEPGIGKTSLIEDFLRELASEGRPCLVARGRCSERLAGAEAYLPILDALDSLLLGGHGLPVARTLERTAPTWFARVAPLAARAAAPAEALAVSQPALQREFTGFLREATRLAPAVLFLDDVHWADLSTVDLLAHLGRQSDDGRVLLVVTYRPTELLLGPHPFLRVKLDLEARGHCRELPLTLWSRGEVTAYLDTAFPNHAFPEDFTDALHARTEGGPLFLTALLRDLRDRGAIAERDGRWVLARGLPELWPELPASVRGLILRQLERLTADDRRLLTAAAVQGAVFDTAAIAGAVGREAGEVEERLQELDRVHGLVRLLGARELPDWAPNLRYQFVHLFYQQALDHDLTATRRALLSAAVARSLEAHQRGDNPAAAAELAALYEAGREFAQAARHCQLASQHAAAVFAHEEAVELARRGLRLVEALPPSAERDALELPLRVALGMQLQVRAGFAAPEVSAVYARARELCDRAAGARPLFSVLWGLWLFHKVRSELGRARAMADELRALAARLAQPALALQAQQALAVTALCRGEPASTVRHMEQAAALYDPQRHRGHSSQFGQDPGVACKAFGAVALWLLGHPDEAARLSAEAVRLGRELGQPSSLALALFFAAVVHQCRGSGPRALVNAEACRFVAAEHGFSFWLAGATVLSGWALSASGDDAEGVARLRRGLADWSATGSVTYQTYFMGLLAEVLLRRREVAEARQVLDEALALLRRTGERLYEAELHRQNGELLRMTGFPREAAENFHRALDVARSQGARSFELRAAASLTRLQGDAEARTLLADAYGRFTEGFETPDLREARALLADAL